MIPCKEIKIRKDDGMWGGYDSRTGKIPILAELELKCPDYRLFNGHATGALEYYSERMEKWQ